MISTCYTALKENDGGDRVQGKNNLQCLREGVY